MGDTAVHTIWHKYQQIFLINWLVLLLKLENPQVVQLISSQVDVDRMDYLLRDAYFTGTKYGEFDIDRILRTMPNPNRHCL